MTTNSVNALRLLIGLLGAACLTIVACQKDGGGGGDPAPPPNQYTFYGQQDAMSGQYVYEDYDSNRRNRLCTTDNVHYQTRTELCALLRDEARNRNCAAVQRQAYFQQICVNANLPYNDPNNNNNVNNNNGNPNFQNQPQPINNGNRPIVNAGPQRDPFVGNIKRVVCLLDQKRQSYHFFGPVSARAAKDWNTQNPSSISFPNIFIKGSVYVTLVPRRGKESAQFKLEYKKTAEDTSVVVQGPIEHELSLAVMQTEDDDQRETVVSCAVVNEMNFQPAPAKTLRCEGTGTYSSRKKFKISESYPWTAEGTSETIVLGKNDSNTVAITAYPEQRGQPAQINIEIPRNEDREMEFKTISALTRTPTVIQHKDENSGFSVDMKCRLLP